MPITQYLSLSKVAIKYFLITSLKEKCVITGEPTDLLRRKKKTVPETGREVKMGPG